VISFVISAHDEEALIGRTLTAVRAAARAVGEPYEAVVVAEASTDRTAAITGTRCPRRLRPPPPDRGDVQRGSAGDDWRRAGLGWDLLRIRVRLVKAES
jgi:hypothetical protein